MRTVRYDQNWDKTVEKPENYLKIILVGYLFFFLIFMGGG